MSVRFRRKALNIHGVASPGNAILELPVIYRYHFVGLRYTESAVDVTQANMEAAITNIKCITNGVTQRERTARELIDANATNGIPFTAGRLGIYFSEPWRRNAVHEDALAWGMRDVESFTIQLAIAAGRTAPALVAYYKADGVQEDLARIVKWVRRSYTPGGTGLFTISDLTKLETYLRIYLSETAAASISDVHVKADGQTVIDVSDAENQEYLKDQSFVNIADNFPIIFDDTQRASDGYRMRKRNGSPTGEFLLELQIAIANQIDVISEILGNPFK